MADDKPRCEHCGGELMVEGLGGSMGIGVPHPVVEHEPLICIRNLLVEMNKRDERKMRFGD